MSKIDDTFEMLDDTPEKSRKPVLAIGAILLLIVGYGAYALWQKPSIPTAPPAVQPPVASQPVNPPAPVPAPTKKVPTPVNIVVNFDSSSYEIKPDQLAKLQALAKLITDNPGTMQISAYTDDEGSDEAGQWLSEQRAAAVVQVFKNLGVDGKIKYNVNAYGELYPIASNSTEAGRALNRRVEIYYSPAK